jgi:hypothetical protein
MQPKSASSPFADPDEHRNLMGRMDEEEQRISQLAGKLKIIDTEISKEEQRLPI